MARLRTTHTIGNAAEELRPTVKIKAEYAQSPAAIYKISHGQQEYLFRPPHCDCHSKLYQLTKSSIMVSFTLFAILAAVPTVLTAPFQVTRFYSFEPSGRQQTDVYRTNFNVTDPNRPGVISTYCSTTWYAVQKYRYRCRKPI